MTRGCFTTAAVVCGVLFFFLLLAADASGQRNEYFLSLVLSGLWGV